MHHKRLKSGHVKDYSDLSVLSSVLQDEGEYGSVTKDYEALERQTMKVMNFYSQLQVSLSSPHSDPQRLSRAYEVTSPNGCQEIAIAHSDPQRLSRTSEVTSPNGCQEIAIAHSDPQRLSPASEATSPNGCREISIAQDVINLEEPSEPESKSGNNLQSPIVVDSDDEDGPSHVQQCNSARLRDFRAWLTSQIQQRLNNDMLSFGAANAVLKSNGQALAIEGKKLPSVNYEKVILKNVTGATGQLDDRDIQNQRLDTINRDKEGEAHPSVLNLDKSHRVKAARGEREGNAITFDMNMGKEAAFSTTPVSSKDNHGYMTSFVARQNEIETVESDGLDDLWKDMSFAMECSKGATPTGEPRAVVDEEGEECAHTFVLEDDFGLVCRVCGIIQRKIETIFDYQWGKGTRSTRTYMSGARNSNGDDVAETSGVDTIENFLIASDISIHPRHLKQMKPHQIEGFNFLVKNLLGDPPGGCILAHAPGSGKTFMLISFIQSFMAKDSRARPLVVLPKGILAIWRREFERWRVEDIPLYDFYNSKADNRSQQLRILQSWQDNRSILLLGYKQFANIICEGGMNKETTACQDKLLKVPTLLILDEGHTPRNENTDMVGSLAKVRTPCKVVLSGTLFQNHVEEVFNILRLVRPNFTRTESSRAIIKRILSRVHISGSRKPAKGNQESYFCDLVEETLRSDQNYRRKIAVIQDLRDMTRDVLHYYKGDFLDELPGLVDFTVLLNLGPKQKEVIRKLGKLDKFKRSSLEKAIYLHPQLIELKDNALGDKETSINIEKVDAMINSINVREGAKAKFFLSLLSMAESSGEKLLVFSQYLLPLKFLERLTVQVKGWHCGKEIFVISGDSSHEEREVSMDSFNNSSDAKVFFGSIKACGEGISLVGASRVLILDVHLNPSVTRQAIGRAFRPGQEKRVYTYRLVAADSQEEEDHITSFRKELISKMWFEWSEHVGHEKLDLHAIDVEESQDVFFENPALKEDIKALYLR